jgi:hypothetical protein
VDLEPLGKANLGAPDLGDDIETQRRRFAASLHARVGGTALDDKGEARALPCRTQYQLPPSVFAHLRVTNEEFRTTGRQPTLPIADLSEPIFQPWTREELRRHNAVA